MVWISPVLWKSLVVSVWRETRNKVKTAPLESKVAEPAGEDRDRAEANYCSAQPGVAVPVVARMQRHAAEEEATI